MEKNKKFANVEEVKEFMKRYNEENYTNFIVQTNNKRSMTFVCKHGYHRDSTSKGIRGNLTYNFLGCTAKIRLYKAQKGGDIGTLSVTAVDLQHNHSTSKEIFESENVNFIEDEKDLILTLKDANAKPSQIKRILLERSKKKVTITSLKNLINKISPKENEDESREAFERFLEDTEVDGGEVQWIDDKDGKMKALFITSRKMKAAFRSSNPNLIQLDTSFDFDKARYKVAAFCYLDTNSDKSEIAAFAMMSEETKECFDFILGQFTKICIRQDLIFIIDKDFTEQASIRKVFPNSIVLLCVFHTLKFMRVLFSTIPDTVDVKEAVMDQFKKVVYSNTEDIFDRESQKLEEIIQDLQARSGKNYVNLKEYYIRNWKSCKLMWVRCYRKRLPLLGDNTTNRIENKFGRLKESIADTFMSLPSTSSAIIHLVNYGDKTLEERYIARTNKSLRIFSSNPVIRSLNEEASLALNEKGCKLFNMSLKALESKRDSMEILADGGVQETYHDGTKIVYTSTNMSCNCSSFKTFQAACAHVLFIREHEMQVGDGPGIFCLNSFHDRYHRKRVLIDILNNVPDEETNDDQMVDDFEAPIDLEVVEEPAALTPKEKFKKIIPKLTNIGSLIAQHPTKKFYEYLSEFEKIENFIRRGDSIFDDDYEVEIPNPDGTVESIDEENNDVDVVRNQAQETPIEGDNVSSSVENLVPPQKSRFSALQMKEKVKTRGRPKRSSKQLTFNKNAADRKKDELSKKDKTKKSKKTSKEKEFIDEESDEDETEDEEEPEYQDESDDEECEDEELDEDNDTVKFDSDGSQTSLYESSGEVTFNFSSKRKKT